MSLLDNAERGYGTTSTGQPRPERQNAIDLSLQSQAVLDWAAKQRAGRQATIPSFSEERAYLAVFIHARYLLIRRIAGLTGMRESTRRMVSLRREMERDKAHIEMEIGKYLVNGLEGLKPPGRAGEGTLQPEGDHGLVEIDEDAEEEVENLLWTKWIFEGRPLSGESTLKCTSPKPLNVDPLA